MDIPLWGQRHPACFWKQFPEIPASLWCVFTKNAQLEPNHKDTLDEPKLRDYLRKNGPVLSKNVKVTEGKDRGTVSGQRGVRQDG